MYLRERKRKRERDRQSDRQRQGEPYLLQQKPNASASAVRSIIPATMADITAANGKGSETKKTEPAV